MSKYNIAVVAHVDAGKTTLTESLLYCAGAINERGAVDRGTAHTDMLEVERTRGISVRAEPALLQSGDMEIHIIDTPGHTDFASEVERSLRAADGAVLIVSAADGVRPHTAALWSALRARGIPAIIALNKIDMPNVSAEDSAAEIAARLTSDALPVQRSADDLSWAWESECPALENLALTLSEYDPSLLDKYTSGSGKEAVKDAVCAAAREGRFFPIVYTSGLRGTGISELLTAIRLFLPPSSAGDGRLAALIYRITHEGSARVAETRIFSGSISLRDSISTGGEDKKVGRLTLPYANKKGETASASAGDIVNIYGLAGARAGDIIGDASLVPGDGPSIAQHILTSAVTPKDPENTQALLSALRMLSAEDPRLNLLWSRETGELRIFTAGMLQAEVLESILRDRFSLDAGISPAGVIYKETPKRAAEGFEAYTMPKPCWAILKFLVEPLPRGSGVQYSSIVPAKDIMPRYQSQVEDTVPRALMQGLYGWEVTDCRITLIDGNHHLIHTHPLDFIVATPMALMNAWVNAGMQLLEPWMQLAINCPADAAGRLTGELIAVRGSITESVPDGDNFGITAEAPLAELMNFPARLAAITRGQASLYMRLAGYRDCPPGFTAELPRRSVDPRDRAKYILAARSALDGNIFSD